MKKLFSLLILGLIICATTSCFKRDDLENINIYTTVYPIEFLTDTLYGYNSKVLSIYPDGIDIDDYELTEKQINDYSNSSIFIYNGLTKEKEIAREFINHNKKLKIIDVSYGLKYKYGIEELWLSPNNFLMLATTVKKNLQDFMTSKYIKEEIENNYTTKLEDSLSLMDAELRNIGMSAKKGEKYTIIASSSLFKFLEEYNFNVISLDDEENLTKNNLEAIKNNFKKSAYKYIFLPSDEVETDLIKDLVKTYDAKVLKFHTLTNLSDEERKNNETYFTLMRSNIDLISDATIGK